MKKNIILLIALFISITTLAQDQSELPYKFNVVKDNSSTVIKDQCRTGTCWSFATSSFIESEILRLGGKSVNLSEMYNVRVTYPEKAMNYVRYQGKAQFGAGSLSHDVINAIRDYGMVPESVYTGLNYDMERHNHAEMDALLEAMVKAVVKEDKRNITDKWDDAIAAVLDVYLGKIPKNFDYEGKKYTPTSFRDAMGIHADDYVEITSFTHHPFYKKFILEVPDNFSQGQFQNVPIEELYDIVKKAINDGYTVAWDADVSEKTFSFRNGMAILPAKGVKKDDYFKKIVPELKVDQAFRQKGFNDFQTTDDHLMHITGIAKDQDGKEYFIIKNSWGQNNPFGGHQYISAEYFKGKTISVMLHKDALSKEMKKKLGL